MNWDLNRLYRGFDDPAFEADMSRLQSGISAARELVSTIGDAGRLHAAVEQLCDLEDVAGKLFGMIFMTLAADSSCTSALGPRQRILELDNELSLVFHDFTRAVGNEVNLYDWIAADPLLSEHTAMLLRCREECAHLIEPALEPTVLRMKLTGGEAWVRLREELVSGLNIEMVLDGERKSLPLSAVRALAYDARADVRRAAYEAELAAYPRIETPLAACLSNILGEARTMSELRRYPSVLDASLDADRMDRATLDALLAAMRESLPTFREYFRVKAKLLGYDGGLKFCDLFAPLGNSAISYTLDDARALLLEVFGAHNPEIAAVIRRAFDERRIDAYPRPGKEGGAFCECVHALGESFILTNFDGSLSDISTLAHELGHAYHGDCLKDVSPLLNDVPAPLAETASTFNEILFAEELLSRTPSTAGRMLLLDQQLTDAAQVIVDILSRFLFERKAVECRADSALTAEDFRALMREAQLESYGDGLDADFLHPYMWACKSHYYSADYHFYNYPYAFGLLFAAGLYEKYREMGDTFWPLYRRILRLSGSGTVRETAAAAGIDVTDPAFWHKSLQFFREKLDELKKCAENV